MASIHKQVKLQAAASEVWDALADFGRLHERLVPGFVTNATLEGTTRTITFANGATTREVLVTSDPAGMRLVYAAQSDRVKHYNAAAQVFAEGTGSRFEWTIDLLPDEIAPYVASQMDLGLAAIAKKFGAR
jgi:carbon monoxide dehydrogenase subunit G